MGGGLFSLPFSFCFLALPLGSSLYTPCVLLGCPRVPFVSNIFLFLPIKKKEKKNNQMEANFVSKNPLLLVEKPHHSLRS